MSPLRDESLFGTVDKAADTVALMRDLEPEEGYYLAFSGGKDSIVLKDLADRAGVKYDAHYNVTTIDPPPLVHFIRDRYPTVSWNRPKCAFLTKVGTRGFPLRHRRWCCSEYKEQSGKNRMIMTGVRKAESSARSRRKVVEVCYRDTSKRFVHPLIYWTDQNIWEYIRGNSLPYCHLYDEGFTRLGCLFCPMAKQETRLMQAERWPRWRDAFCRAFIRYYEHRAAQEKKTVLDRWASGEEMFDWWLHLDRYVKGAAEPEETLFQ